MAIKYKIMPLKGIDDKVMYYAKAVMTDQMDLNSVAETIQRNCTLKKSDVVAVLTELVEVMTDALQDSKKVRLNGLGSFQIGIRAKSVTDPKNFSPSTNILGFKVNFRPEYTVDPDGTRHTQLIGGVRAKAFEAPAKEEKNDATE